MAHFLAVVPILIIGMFIAGMFFVIFRFFSPSLNERSNQRLRKFVGGPLLITVGFSLEQLFPLFTSFWFAIPVIILSIGGLVIFSQTPAKQERQADQDSREPGKLIQKQPQPKETREEE